MLGDTEFQHLCYLPTVQEAPGALVRARHCLLEVQDAEPGPPSAASHRGGFRLPHAGRHPRTETHPTSNGLPDPALLGTASPRSHAARRRRARGAPRPQAKNKRGRGRARLRPRPSRAAGPRFSPPRLRAARNGGRATKWQPAGRAGGGVEMPVAGHSPVPAVPSPEFGGRLCEDKWSGLAGHPRERSYGRRGSGSPGPPSPPPPRRMPSPRLHFENVPVVPRPPAPSLAPAGSACRAGRVQLGAASVPMCLPGGECGVGLGLRPVAVYFGVFRRPLSEEKRNRSPIPQLPFVSVFPETSQGNSAKRHRLRSPSPITPPF